MELVDWKKGSQLVSVRITKHESKDLGEQSQMASPDISIPSLILRFLLLALPLVINSRLKMYIAGKI